MPEKSHIAKPADARKAGRNPAARRLRSGIFIAIGHATLGTAFSTALGILLSLAISVPANAGDILRGGAPMSSSGGSASYGTNPAAVEQARANAKDALARTTQAIQSVKAMQSAARALAVSRNNLGLDPNHPGQQLPNVPNGLGVGGLQVAPHVPVDLAHPAAGEDSNLWQGANLPTQTVSNGKTDVTIKQTAQQALLNWQTFNIGKDTTLNFDQSAGGNNTSEWIAFNKINDPSGSPSQILGRMNAKGQVYVINQNGIIFGGASQINLHTLVASSLPVNDNLISRGLLNNPDSQFLFSSLPIPAGSNGTPAFLPALANTPGGINGDITVQPGASISTPTTAEHVGGRVALIGSNVTNGGAISTPDGQTILAAGQQVGIAAHANSDPSLRGLDVYIGLGSGIATNAQGGLIDSPRAAITLAAKTVNQFGVIESTTSVALNGRIDLLANYNSASNGKNPELPPFLPAAAGNVTLGAGSVTQILPEWSSLDRVVGTQLALPSQVNLQGQSIHLASGAQILAPNANIGLNAGIWDLFYVSGAPKEQFVYTGGQIFLDSGASIYAAGSTDVLAPISENIVSVQLRGAELADSALQRFGALRGQTLNLDIRQTGIYNGVSWVGTPLADASGYVGIIQRTVGELTTAGGRVNLNAGDSVVMQPGSLIDVSGGTINYQGGVVETSRVLSQGHLLDISQATPDRIYDGIYTGSFLQEHAKYGISEIFTNPLMGNAHYEEGYVYGGNGGAIDIMAPSVALDGRLFGNTVSGPRQRSVMAKPSSLSLTFQAQDPSTVQFRNYSPTPPSIVFQTDASLKPADPFALDAGGAPLSLRADRKNEVILSPDLLGGDGFGILKIDNVDGNISVPSGVSLAGSAISYLDSKGAIQGGALTLSGKNIDIEGSVTMPHGDLTFNVYDFSPTQTAQFLLSNSSSPKTPPRDPTRGHFTLGGGASLDAAGLIVDDRYSSSSAESLPLVTGGGTITINSYTANLEQGSLIDVSGGGVINANGKPSYGGGGGIVIKAGQDPTTLSLLGGQLTLDAELKGYSGARGGSLEIQAALIQIGGAATHADTLVLFPDFFSQGGFTSFSLTGLGASTSQADLFLPGIVIAQDAQIDPIALNSIAITKKGGNGVVMSPILLPQGLRTPVDLVFNATGVTSNLAGDVNPITGSLLVRGDFVMNPGARIETDPGGSVTILGQTASVMGSIITPGGTISISGGKDSSVLFANKSQALPTVDLGPDCVLSAAGTTLLTPDPNGRGYRLGSVLSGGKIKISGNIVAEAGAVLDVSGASDVLDLPPSFVGAVATLDGSVPFSVGVDQLSAGSLLNGISVLPSFGFGGVSAPLNGSLTGSIAIPVRVDSNGGSITLNGTQELFTNATLIGNAGGDSALGGSLFISSGRYYSPGTTLESQTPLDVALVLTQNAKRFHFTGQTGIGAAILDTNGNPVASEGHFAANDFNHHGFDSLSLQGTVQFSGPVNITADGSVTIVSDLKFGNGIALLADPDVANSSLHLAAPYVALGTFQAPLNPNSQAIVSPFTEGDKSTPFALAPSWGTGSLDIKAGQLIDIGNVSLQNIGNANFNVANGDIRGDGTLDVQGSVTLTAGQIYPPTALTFNLFAYDHGADKGSITIVRGSNRQLPLSAGGSLNIYASLINQGGVLRAPMGSINLGWDGSGAAPSDPIAFKSTISPTATLTLAPGGVTSVSSIDPLTGQGLVIPYGIILNGISWIDPTATDITNSGPPSKAIHLSAKDLDVSQGATIDIRGGGDLYAYRFVPGIGGSKDILASTSSFAVIPGYQAGYSPYAAYSSTSDAGKTTNQLGGDPGYVNSGLHVGDQVYLGASDGLPAGAYTLLPARYALLPGAFLVTPKAGTPIGTVAQSDGSSLVSGYRFNSSQTSQPLVTRFEVDSQSVVLSRAEYDSFTASTFLKSGAQSVGTRHLPSDSGQLVLEATQGMNLQGTILSQAAAGGRGGSVDISSQVDILINSSGQDSTFSGLVLSSSELTGIGAESLLIGGVRQTNANGAGVTVETGNLTVDNAGAVLSGPDVILVANKNLTVDPGADIESSGGGGTAETLLLGKTDSNGAGIAGSGNGVLLRVSSDPSAQIIRTGVGTQSAQAALPISPSMSIGGGATIKGESLTLDSTYATNLDSTAKLSGNTVSLNSGQISLQLSNPGSLESTVGLVLSGQALQDVLAGSKAVSLLSYSSIDIYGSGQVGALDAAGKPTVASLALHAAEIRGFNNGGGAVKFTAQSISLDNRSGGSALGSIAAPEGTLEFDADTIQLGVNQLNVDQYANLALNASGGVLAQGVGGLATQGDLMVTTPVITGAASANHSIIAIGGLTIQNPGTEAVDSVVGGLGSSLVLQGSSITEDSNIHLASGVLTLHATQGDVTIGGQLNVAGQAQSFFDLTKYTSGGQINLISDQGNVNVAAGSAITAIAQPGGGDAGGLTVSAPTGTFTVADGTLFGQGGEGGQNGTFSLDAGSLPSLSSLNLALTAAFFTQSQAIRVRNGDVLVDGLATAHQFDLSVDNGSITVTGQIDAHGLTGGAISLEAHGGVTLQAGSLLTAVGDYYDNAGKGGTITLEAGDETHGANGNGFIDIQTGSEIELGVNHQLTTSDLSLGKTTDNRTDLFSGVLHLRAPRTAAGTDLQINAINGSINNASVILVEGSKVYDLTSSGGDISSAVQTTVKNDAITFAGNAGTTTASYTAMQNRLFANNIGLEATAVIEPGVEIINTTGDLTLSSDWDFASFRFGANRVAGDLTLRAAGNLVFNGSLSDGFASSAYNSELMAGNPLLSANAQSWSYRLVAGADFGAANFRNIQSLSLLSRVNPGDPNGPKEDIGSILLGKDNKTNVSIPGSAEDDIAAPNEADIATAVAGHFQVIRTGAGDIDVSAGRDVQLLNHFASIYTVGTQAAALDNFDLPQLYPNASGFSEALYPAQYSSGGGNVRVSAQGSILHLTKDNFGNVIEDSVRELPTNWLDRRGYVDASGHFGQSIWGEIASTTWWVNFSNFFEGIGTLGGGNVSLRAGQDIRNVDAVIPTNARMAGYDSALNPAIPDSRNLVELGGGDLSIRAGNNVSGGVYYVERGQGTIDAGNSILTNSTRAPFPTNLYSDSLSYASSTWLPTTLFVGKGSFSVAARNDLLLGPVVNPFLLPGGIGNTYWYKTYFSTYDSNDAIILSSLAGNISLRENVVSQGSGPILQEWMQYASLYSTRSAAYYQPWLRLNETDLSPFTTAISLMPSTLEATAFSGDINLAGKLTLSPSAAGTIELAAQGSINALQIVGSSIWLAGSINLSDTNPESIPGVASPFAYQTLVGMDTDSAMDTRSQFLFSQIDLLFNESGATGSVLQTKQALHSPDLLHSQDRDPANIYAVDGSISGLTLYSAKASQVKAGQDITDIAFYLQNNSASDISSVTAGNDLIAYDPTSPLRTLAVSKGNRLAGTSQEPLAGDIQISGPGTLEVFAGHDLDLGLGPNNSDGTGVGIVSIGNARNPNLPFAGADIVAGAGVNYGQMDFQSFIANFIDGADGSRYLGELAAMAGASGVGDSASFDKLTDAQQAKLATQIFYLVLRDAGRDHNLAGAPGFGTYNAGFAAIAALFPGTAWAGDISTGSRDIRTKSGGSISLLAPGGMLTLATSVSGNSLAPPGIITEDGGNIGIFTANNVNIGVSRIFTLRGGNEIIWSSAGNIAAGSSSKTVLSAPPTRVLIDPQSADIKTDLAGLATGGGIGVLATVVGVPPGDVDLVAPAGTIDAGDAGIRVSGNINIAAAIVLNAGNIQAGGASSGVPSTAVAAPNLGGLTAASNTAGAGASSADEAAKQQARSQQTPQEEAPSIITVEVIGYGGGDGAI